MDFSSLDISPSLLQALLESNAVKLTNNEDLALHDADKMLNLGFKEEMNRIFTLLLNRSQNLLFSLNLYEDFTNINPTLLHGPLLIKNKPESDNIYPPQQLAHIEHMKEKGNLEGENKINLNYLNT